MNKKTTLQGLATLISKGFASADGKFTALAEDVADVRKTMATREDIAGIMAELADIKRRLKDVEAAVEDHGGHSKEIDHAFERIAAIEKHLGINKRTAA
jgi:hypothetical protein